MTSLKSFEVRTSIMKDRNAQSEKMLNIAAVRHAVRTEMDLSKLLLMHRKNLSDAWQELKLFREQTATLLTLLRQRMQKIIFVCYQINLTML